VKDPFELLGLEPRFDLDLGELERRHRELSKALHPDRHASAPAAERRMALSRAIEVNEAMRALRDPIRRAEALARGLGLPVGETSEPKPSPALLMDMMEAREELSDAGRKKDVGALAKLGDAMRRREAGVLERLGGAFTAGQSDPTKLDGVLPLLGELRYVRRFLEEVSALEEAALESP
jgi:molecular chaperone HscB